jgi:two-component system alkaline phosphatase synthesis response regulator PhoP
MSELSSRSRILVVDDEPKVISIVRGYLERDGFQVNEALDGKRALEFLKRVSPDLIILDIMLPQVDGLDVLKEIRQTSKVPVIMLTARTEDSDKLIGLELGADDYVTKPFSPRELVARVKAVLRRSQNTGSTPSGKTPICVGDLKIDPQRFEARCHDQVINLTATEFRILLALAESAGRVLTRSQLMDRALGESYEGYDRTIDAHIKNIRHKLPAVQEGKGCNILTVQGVGYKLEEDRCE